MKPTLRPLPGKESYFKKGISLIDAIKVPYFISLFLLLPLIILSLFQSCNSSSEAKAVPKDSLHIPLPPAIPLSAEETARYAANCSYWYNRYLKNGVFNGGMVVAKNGNIVFEVYKGSQHVGTGDKITDSTPLHIASVSKTFTAMAILKLYENGKLSLDDELSKFFPGFNYPGVTVRTLLNHRSGLPNYLYFMDDLGWDKKQFVRNEDVMNYLITRKSEIPNISSANTHFTYCNTNYALLALLVEKVSGLSFGEYLKRTFFIPLKMNHSFVYSSADSALASPSYDWKGNVIPDNFLDRVYGDKNIYSTPRDLLTWDKALRCNLLFSPQTLEMAYYPYSNEKPGMRNYGLGWRMNVFPDGNKIIFHNGWWHGSNAVFIRLIEENATIIVIGSRYTNAIYKAKLLAGIFDKNEMRDDDDDIHDTFPKNK